MRLRIRRKGYALATVLVLLGVCLFGAGAIVTISTLESRISRSQQESVTAYYVTEAGMQDALWRLNTNAAYGAALTAGTLNATYSAANTPAAGQGYTVTMTSSPALGAGYATIDVSGTRDNGVFVAKRRIQATVFKGTVPAGGGASPTGDVGMLIGGVASINNGNNTVNISGGDFQSNSVISINGTTVNMNGRRIMTPNLYSAWGSTIQNLGGVNASSCSPTPPGGCQTAPAALTPPSFDFAYYSANYNNRYTAAQFQSIVSSGGSTINFPGPVTYISDGLNIGSWMNNKTVNITGMLVVAGGVTAYSIPSGTINFIDPGTGKSGLFTSGGFYTGSGTWNVNGVLYAASGVTVSGAQQMNVNGAFITGGVLSLNTGFAMNLTYNAARTAASFTVGAGGGGAAQALSVQYWEEEY